MVFVVDGLRPDAITPDLTPTLFRLRAEGVEFPNSHAVFPTVTRVNAAALSTGMQPGTNGILGNQMYVPAVNPQKAFNTGDYRQLLRLDEVTGGRLLHAKTLAERLHERGASLAAVSSGSTGSAFLLNPSARAGVGVLVNGAFDPGRTVAYPSSASDAILAKFGAAPPKPPGAARYDASVAWAQRVLREHVLPDLAPAVVINWLTEPDHSQHHLGVGSPSSREALANSDREIGIVLDTVASLGRAAATDVLVVSDHGFTANTAGVDVAGALIGAGLKAARDSTDVVLASSGQAVALHVEGHDPDRIARLVRFIQSAPWGGVVFVEGAASGDSRGRVDGTFSLELVHARSRERGADVLFTFPWTSLRSAFDVPGADLANVDGGGAPYPSDHGSMSPWNVRNTFIGWGPSFKKRAVVRAPVGNADVAPTILHLLGMTEPDALDGRVLVEALDGSGDEEHVLAETRVHTVETGGYRAAIQVSVADGRRYLDKSWRVAS